MSFLRNMLHGGAGISAANNAHLAELTLSKLSTAQKQLVMENLLVVMHIGAPHLSYDDFNRMFRDAPRIVQLNFLAFTMLHCGIPPTVTGEQWQLVKNPFATMVDGVDIRTNAAHFLRKYGITVAIKDEPFEAFEWFNFPPNISPTSRMDSMVVEKCKSAAEQGDMFAQYMLAVHYIDGEVVQRDFDRAATWLRKAAAQGNADAHYLLGIMHEGGEGATQDIQQAASHMRQAAELGHTEAQVWIDQHTVYQSNTPADQDNSEMTFDDGVEAYDHQDYTKALGIWLPLAEQGNAQAQYRVGLMYFKGLGVARDYALAMAWYRKASAQGNADANFSLGLMYSTGSGVTQDEFQAEIWFRKAAAQGHMGALGTLQARQNSTSTKRTPR